jgi:hypothetical protein
MRSRAKWRPAAAGLLIAAVFSALASGQDAGTAALERVAQAIQAWDGRDPGVLFKAAKAANPDTAAIVSMRELNKAFVDKTMPAPIAEQSAAIIQKQKAAQRAVRAAVLGAREGSYARFRATHPEAARSIYGSGDIGSWPTSTDPDASMDIDWTVFGVDPDVTAQLRDDCKAERTDTLKMLRSRPREPSRASWMCRFVRSGSQLLTRRPSAGTTHERLAFIRSTTPFLTVETFRSP